MKIWKFCLGGWLILSGLAAVVGMTFAGMGVILGVLAILTGILILIDR